MLWVYLIASVGLAGIIVETWFSHRKATAQVREDITRVRTGIRQHQSATTPSKTSGRRPKNTRGS